LNCVSESTATAYIDDGYCDDGSYGYDLRCEAFLFDADDCEDATDADGGPPPDTCDDLMYWEDAYGVGCEAYEATPSWCDIAEYWASDDGTSATDACCICGGGGSEGEIGCVSSEGPSETFEYPTTEAFVVTLGGSSALGEGGGGRYFVAGTTLTETIDTTSLGRIDGLEITISMDDWTGSWCPVGTLSFDVSVNGEVVGSYSYEGGDGLREITFSRHFDFPGIDGFGDTGRSYTVSIVANETVCSGGGSYNWLSGGEISLHE
jgi:hypothetical protein